MLPGPHSLPLRTRYRLIRIDNVRKDWSIWGDRSSRLVKNSKDYGISDLPESDLLKSSHGRMRAWIHASYMHHNYLLQERKRRWLIQQAKDLINVITNISLAFGRGRFKLIPFDTSPLKTADTPCHRFEQASSSPPEEGYFQFQIQAASHDPDMPYLPRL